MANEGQLNVGMNVTKGFFRVDENPGLMNFDVTADPPLMGPGVIDIGTTETLIDFSSVPNPGVGWLENTDDTNFVEIFIKEASNYLPIARLFPGKACPIFFTSELLYGKFDTAAGTINAIAIEV